MKNRLCCCIPMSHAFRFILLLILCDFCTACYNMADYVVQSYWDDGYICKTDWILSGVYFAINIP